MGISYPLDIPECVTLNADDRQQEIRMGNLYKILPIRMYKNKDDRSWLAIFCFTQFSTDFLKARHGFSDSMEYWIKQSTPKH